MFRHKRFISRGVLAGLLMLPVVCFGNFKEGDRLPDLAGFELEGKLPAELKGQVILLDFWASWCGPCKSSFPAMEKLKEKYGERGLRVVAVSVDEKQQNVAEFLKSAKVSFTVVRDGRHKLVETADIRSMPASFLIDRSGKIRFVHGGFDREKTPGEYEKEIEQLLKEAKP